MLWPTGAGLLRDCQPRPVTAAQKLSQKPKGNRVLIESALRMTVIPAKTGIQGVRQMRLFGVTKGVDSRFLGNDGFKGAQGFRTRLSC